MRTSIIACALAVATATQCGGATGQVDRTTNPYQRAALEFAKLTPIQQINVYWELIRKEVSSPTETRRGAGGGMITHQYQLNQFEIGLFNVLARPTVSGRDIAEPDVILYVRALAQEEKNPEAKQVYERVLDRFDKLNLSRNETAEPDESSVPSKAAPSASSDVR